MKWIDVLRESNRTMENSNEIWVFLSHSHEDYEKVRKVRDMLEDQHMRPLMFFLKCLNDHDEIDSLIKREIDCRTRFILCDSENARKSDWVKEEVKYIKDQDRIYETINVDWPIEKIKSKLSEFKRKATLFISYNRENQKLARTIYERLSKFDFQIFVDMDLLRPGDDYLKTVISSLDSAAANGYIIALMNDRILAAGSGSRHEIRRALKYDRKNGTKSIIPFVTTKGLVESISHDEELGILKGYDIRDISDKQNIEQCNEVVNHVLLKMLTPGAILTHAHNFKNGVNCSVDMEEAENLYSLYFKLTTEAGNHSLSALHGLGQCYEFGWGTPVDLNAAWECYSELRCERPGQSTFIDACTRVTSKMDNSNNHCSSKSIQVPQKLSKFQRLFKSLRQIICNH